MAEFGLLRELMVTMDLMSMGNTVEVTVEGDW
jgi:hypothetical protein